MALMMNTTTQVPVTPEQETAFEQFLRKCIERLCWNGEYSVYFSYNDRVEEDTINETFFDYVKKYHKYYDCFSDYLTNVIQDKWYIYDYEDNLIEDIKDAARREPDFISEILEYVEDECLFWDYLYKCGYNGLSWDVHEIVSDTKVNLLLATKEELNQDLSSISAAFIDKEGSHWNTANAKDNALNYLIRQQGYFTKSEDFLTYKIEDCKNKFLTSVDNELNNAYDGDCHCLTVLISADLDTLDKLADILLKKETAKQKITVTKNCEIGLLAPFVGGGSTLDIQLEKDFEFPADMLYDVQIEHRGHYSGIHGFYTVDDIYCLCGECWRATAKFE